MTETDGAWSKQAKVVRRVDAIHDRFQRVQTKVCAGSLRWQRGGPVSFLRASLFPLTITWTCNTIYL